MPRPYARRGFSFVEILFAITVPGIGFIMIAAIFPVAITQTQAAAEQSTGRAVAEGAKVQVEYAFRRSRLAGEGIPNTNNRFTSYRNGIAGFLAMDRINGSRLVAADRRFAWVPLYKYDDATNAAEVYIVAVQVRNKSAYEVADLRALEPVEGQATLHLGNGAGPDWVKIDPGTNAGQAAAEGAYIIRADGGPPLRIGSAIDQLAGEWELIQNPEANLSPADSDQTVDILIVGRGLNDYSQGHQLNQYAGGAQDAYVIGPYAFTP